MELLTFHLIILSLATWRFSSLISYEDGPFDMCKKFRGWLGADDDDLEAPEGFLAKLVSCLKCNSVWVGAFLWIAYAIFPEATVWVSGLFALSAVACYLDK